MKKKASRKKNQSKSIINIRNITKMKKKEIINQAVIDLLEKTENIDLVTKVTTPKKESDPSFWTKVTNLFNPFKCTQNN